ncbi:MAG: hypothetical protein OSB68_05820, partial [Dehalococcoidia bacterium]|nr:hypothetical protein [Dehalococcoidia bacterium]
HDAPYPEEMNRVRNQIKGAADRNGLKFLSSWSDPSKTDGENIQVLIDMGAHIFSGGGEEKATVGRKMTKRQMPVG